MSDNDVVKSKIATDSKDFMDNNRRFENFDLVIMFDCRMISVADFIIRFKEIVGVKEVVRLDDDCIGVKNIHRDKIPDIESMEEASLIFIMLSWFSKNNIKMPPRFDCVKN